MEILINAYEFNDMFKAVRGFVAADEEKAYAGVHLRAEGYTLTATALDGYKLIHMYYGTSTYTADEMRVLIDWLVDQAEQMQIRIPIGKAEQERLLAQWGRR